MISEFGLSMNYSDKKKLKSKFLGERRGGEFVPCNIKQQISVYAIKLELG